MFVYFVFFLNRFLGSTKIHLRELSSGQVRSLPSRNVPLVNESGQNIGVSLTNLRNWKTIFKKKKKNEIIEHPTFLFQATIDLMIGYDPPANSAPNLNDPQAGDATADAGTFI